ncbi:MAG: peptide chain release factor 1 [Planctomycetes bacterium]|nr:peptide chain release factor 1 [Planctomycetota bacterium]
MQNKLDEIITRYNELESLITKPENIANPPLYAKLMKERGKLMPVAQRAKALEEIRKQKAGAIAMSQSSAEDKELAQMAEEEIKTLSEKETTLQSELEELLLPGSEEYSRDAIVEIRAGTGGEEAALFAADLVRMYLKYCEKKGWKTSIMESSPTDLGGVKQAIFSVEGTDVFKFLRFESGTHRVQRVPKTEASGRLHTSAATVAVLPDAEDVDIEIKTEDLKVDTYSAGGPGGQHVNKTASAIRLTHMPTGIVVACQTERSQHRNRDLAMKLLKTRIYEKQVNETKELRDKIRRTQVGSGDRSEKIRTYNFPQNRITDHRINFSSHNLLVVLDGALDELIDELNKKDREERLKSLSK